MSPTDSKNYSLVTQKMRPRLRRTLNTHHYALPKPYRRKRIAEERPRWKRKLGFYVVSGLVIGTLIGQIADMAEEARRERELPVIAAVAEPEQAESAPLPIQPAGHAVEPEEAPAIAAAQPPSAPQDEAGGAAALAPSADAIPAPEAASGNVAARPPPRRGRPAPPAPREAAPPDPDVVLISAILMLGPEVAGDPEPAVADCPADAPREAGCAELHGMVP